MYTYMHARPPPMKVILYQRYQLVRAAMIASARNSTHRLEYMPGTLASETL